MLIGLAMNDAGGYNAESNVGTSSGPGVEAQRHRWSIWPSWSPTTPRIWIYCGTGTVGSRLGFLGRKPDGGAVPRRFTLRTNVTFRTTTLRRAAQRGVQLPATGHAHPGLTGPAGASRCCLMSSGVLGAQALRVATTTKQGAAVNPRTAGSLLFVRSANGAPTGNKPVPPQVESI